MDITDSVHRGFKLVMALTDQGTEYIDAICENVFQNLALTPTCGALAVISLACEYDGSDGSYFQRNINRHRMNDRFT